MPFKDPTSGTIYNSIVDTLMKQASMSEEDAIKYLTETGGLQKISLDDYKEFRKSITSWDVL